MGACVPCPNCRRHLRAAPTTATAATTTANTTTTPIPTTATPTTTVGSPRLRALPSSSSAQAQPTTGLHITGFEGSTYLLQGRPSTTYNLITERFHHLNIGLYRPPGAPPSHPLHIDEVGLLIANARIAVHLVPGDPARLALTASGPRPQPPVTWPGHPIIDHAVDEGTSYSIRDPNEIVISGMDIRVAVRLVHPEGASTSVDQRAAHLDVHVQQVASYWSGVHGIMGQTHEAAFHSRPYRAFVPGRASSDAPATGVPAATAQLRLQGTEDDYITSGLLNADCRFSRFLVGAAPPPEEAASRKLLLASHAAAGTPPAVVEASSKVFASDAAVSGTPPAARREDLAGGAGVRELGGPVEGVAAAAAGHLQVDHGDVQVDHSGRQLQDVIYVCELPGELHRG